MIEGIVGLPGSGKTYYLAKIGLTEMKKGRKVYANFKLSGAFYYKDLTELVGLRSGVILVDEINIFFSSRFWRSLPPQIMYFWAQSRKMKLDLYWTSQHLSRIDTIIREITNWVWLCQKISPFNLFTLFKTSLYTPESIYHLKNRAFLTNYFFLNKKIYNSYNTYEIIDLPNHLISQHRQAESTKNKTNYTT